MSDEMATKVDKFSPGVVPSRRSAPQNHFARPQHEGEATTFDQPFTGLNAGHDFGQIRVHSQAETRPVAVQAKLTIGQPDDEYEREADRVAERVMHMPEPRVQRQEENPEEEEEEPLQTKPLADQITPLVQRQIEDEEELEEEEGEEPIQAKLADGVRVQRQEEEPEEEEEESVQTKPLASQITPLVQRQIEDEEEEREEEPIQAKLADGARVQRQEEEEEEEPIQTKPTGGETPGSSPGLATQVRSLKGGGQSLPKSTRDFFEPRLGYDLGQVCVHTDARAANTARAANAKAFTVGDDVVFGEGQFAPRTRAGQRLLAHELVHVAQQRMGRKLLQRTIKAYPCAIHVYDQSNPKDTAIIPKDGSGIGVSSVSDMVTKVNAYVNNPKKACSCVSRLEINGHGTDGYQSVGNGDKYVNNAKALVHDSKAAHLRQLANIKFCRTGLFMMFGCHVGRGKGKKLLSRIAKILPGKLVGGAQHYTGGVGLGKQHVAGAGDVIKSDNTLDMSKADPFLTSKYVRWHIVIAGKEYIINGTETTSTAGKAKLKVAERIKVKTPKGTVKIK
jgi:hypothetical protein